MPRTARIAPGGMVFHVLNRAIARIRMFEKEKDFAAFERILAETLRQRPMRICAYCVMPNHWHFLLWPERDGDLAAFMQRLTIAFDAAGGAVALGQPVATGRRRVQASDSIGGMAHADP